MAGSFMSLVYLLLFTNPLATLSVVFLFYLSLEVFLISFGYLVFYKLTGPTRGFKIRLVSLSTILVAVLMFSSTHSLSLVDLLVFFLTGYGLWFYVKHRA